jgi:Protein of unknown function (DUF3179)
MIASPPERTRWTTYTVVLLACLLVSLGCVVFPMYVIRPFRAQGARELAAALVVARFRPMVTLLSAIAILGALIWYWREPARRWRRVIAAMGAGLVCVLAAAGRVNVFELMFHPVDRASFAAAAKVKLDKDERVIAVKIGASARAYPIRGMSYHHIINDLVDNVAIVATY